jgi:hypothetical protein
MFAHRPAGARVLPNQGYRPGRKTARRQDKKRKRKGGGSWGLPAPGISRNRSQRRTCYFYYRFLGSEQFTKPGEDVSFKHFEKTLALAIRELNPLRDDSSGS